ncbi:hypothetical protein F2Q69_00055204 [Brassica cretica]|uniref:Transmembrane protein n=1 Tax=Brassica cretica TaxID=69181 RepID=A0A8S9N2Z1_BRACR|nr:hypothetical protein F2Q69_00055204 [Brassica cretica]
MDFDGFVLSSKRKRMVISVFSEGSSRELRHDTDVFPCSASSSLGAVFVFLFLIVKLSYGIY